MYQKILLSILGLFLISCAPIQRYEKVVQRSYRRSQSYKGYRKKTDENITYLKLRRNKDKLFFLVRKEDDVVELLLSVKYKGRDWMYMSKIKFIDLETQESYLLDFYEHKLYRPIWKDRTTIGMKVEEYIAFPLRKDEVENIIDFIYRDNIQIKLYSDFDERTFSRNLGEREKNRLIQVFEFFNELQDKLIEEAKEKERLLLEEKKLDINKEEFYEDIKK